MGSIGVGQLKPILSRLRDEIATTKRSLSREGQTETANTRPEATPTKMLKNKKQGSWLPVRNRLMDLPAFEPDEPGSQPGTPATSSPKSPRVYPGFSKWRYVAAASLVLILVLALSYARFRGSLAEPPDRSDERPIVASAQAADTRAAAQAQGALAAPSSAERETSSEPAAALENLPITATEPVKTSAGSAGSEDKPRVISTEPVQQPQSSAAKDASADPATDGTESALEASPEEIPAAAEAESATAPEVARARKLALPEVWIGDLVEPGEGVVAPQLVEADEFVASAEEDAQAVVARVLVDHLGNVVEVEIPETEGANSANKGRLVETAKNIRFVPANKDGVPVKMWTELRLRLSGRG
jgi:hypothetical protein